MNLGSLIQNWSIIQRLNRRLVSLYSTSPRELFVEQLKNRTLLRVNGDDVHEYLQGLITNDMNHLNGTSKCMYAMLLNGKGRTLYDTIIYRTNVPNTYLIEGDSSAWNSLKKHLLIYRVRKKISVEVADDVNLWVMKEGTDLMSTCRKDSMRTFLDILKSVLKNCLVCCDPRIPDLGVRVIAHKDMNIASVVNTIPGYQAISRNFYRSLRYKFGVGEGVRELTPGQSFPLEANCDYLSGVSFHKGCYIGQELTARSYHTGVIRKRLMPVTFQEDLILNEHDLPVFLENERESVVGKLKGVEGKAGIALLRVEQVLKSPNLRILDKICTTNRPFWWPSKQSEA